MFNKKLKSLVLALILFPLLSACTITTTSSSPTSTAADSSIFFSQDKGDIWRVMAYLPIVSGSPKNISDINVNLLTMDPEDSKAIYLASLDQGLYYTYTIGNGWNYVSGLPKTTINDVKVDPKSKCIIYAALSNRVYRSADCTRTWTQIYYDNNTGVNVTSIVIDHYNTQNLYIGTSRGEIIKSIDSGNSWRTIQNMEEGVAKLETSPQDSRLIFVATVKNRIFSFTSNTLTNAADSANLEQNFLVENWTDLNAVLEGFSLGANFRELMMANDGTMFLATDKLIVQSKDNGITWEEIKLIQPEKDAVINAFAINPQNSLEIYYVTNTTFFRSDDGGATWTTKKLPTARSGRAILVDFNNPTVLYLGTKKLK